MGYPQVGSRPPTCGETLFGFQDLPCGEDSFMNSRPSWRRAIGFHLPLWCLDQEVPPMLTFGYENCVWL